MQFITIIIIIQGATAYRKSDEAAELYGGKGKDKSAGQRKSARQQQIQDKKNKEKDNGDKESISKQQEKYDHRNHPG